MQVTLTGPCLLELILAGNSIIHHMIKHWKVKRNIWNMNEIHSQNYLLSYSSWTVLEIMKIMNDLPKQPMNTLIFIQKFIFPKLTYFKVPCDNMNININTKMAIQINILFPVDKNNICQFSIAPLNSLKLKPVQLFISTVSLLKRL